MIPIRYCYQFQEELSGTSITIILSYFQSHMKSHEYIVISGFNRSKVGKIIGSLASLISGFWFLLF
jgi:hypothetical protein